MIRDLATEDAKRELFDRVARHSKVLADEIERAIADLARDGRIIP